MSDKPKILCVDDKVNNLQIRAMLLQQFGCEPILASDHTSALRACQENHIDLAILDYHLAGSETGEDLARQLRVRYPNIPLILLTGDTQLPGSVAQVVDAVLIKGMGTGRTLLDMIDKLLPHAALATRPPVRISEIAQSKQPQAAPKRRKTP